jgi:hypothetical protein
MKADAAARVEDDALHRLLREILAGQARIEAALARLAPAQRLSRADRQVLLRLLPILYVTFGAAAFTAREVIETDVLREACQNRSPKSIGKLFARAAGVMVNGLHLEHYGEDGHVNLWRVVSLGIFGETNDVKAA